ncbi:MAG: hypothetical protein JJT82_08045 [Legionellaceae bacterium]|nr:hypothetical protein [Legionellaceae bacterium]
MSKFTVTIDVVRQFFENNKSFFTMPINDQQAFGAYFTKHKQVDVITDYSQKFMSLLSGIQHETGNYKEPLLNVWMHQQIPGDPRPKGWNFEEAFKHAEIRKFIMDHANHPAIQTWQEEHPAKNVELKKTVLSHDERLNQLQNIDLIHDITERLYDALGNFIDQYKATPSPSTYSQKMTQDLVAAQKQITLLNGQWGKIAFARKMLEDEKEDVKIGDWVKVCQTIFNVVNNSLYKMTQEPLIVEWVEKFLGSLAKFFGFEGYDSASKNEWTGDENFIPIMIHAVNASLSDRPGGIITHICREKGQALKEQTAPQEEQEQTSQMIAP